MSTNDLKVFIQSFSYRLLIKK